MVDKYIPKQKDIALVDLQPTKGHEQAGYRPCVVISNNIFNKFTKMVIVCPITTNSKDFPTHYKLEYSKKIKGAVLCEHIRSIDYETRKLKFIEKMNDSDFEEVMALINACVEETNSKAISY